MPIPILPQVLETIGRSFAWEEGLGDYRKARQLAEAQCRTATDPLEKAIALLTLGAVHLLRGNVRLAQQCRTLAEAEQVQDERLELFLAVFSSLADHERFNTKLDGASSEALEAKARWDMQAEEQLKVPRQIRLREQCTDRPCQDLAWYISEVISVGKTARSIGSQWALAQSHEGNSSWLQSVLANLERTASLAHQQQLWDYAVFPLLLRADIFHRAGQHEEAASTLAQAKKNAGTAQDKLRAVWCSVIRADWLATSFSTPQAWDLAVQDSGLESSALTAVTEYAEFPPISEADLQRAERGYRRALKQFQTAATPRAAAFIHLRLAYVKIRRESWKTAEKYIDQAEPLFRQAEDFRGLMLARLYRVLIRLQLQQWDTVLEKAATIGRWGRWSGNFSFVQSLGLLINRFARHQFLRHGRYETARMAYRTAHALFSALPAPVNATQNLADLGVLHQALGDIPSALTELRRATDQYLRLVDDPPAYWPQHRNVRIPVIRYAAMLCQQGYALANGQMDTLQMQYFQDRIRSLLLLLNPSGEAAAKMTESWEEMQVFSLMQMAVYLDQQASVLIPYYQYKKTPGPTGRSYWEQAFQAAEQLPEQSSLFYQTLLWAAKEDRQQAARVYRKLLDLTESRLPALPENAVLESRQINAGTTDIGEHRYYWEEAMLMWTQLKQFREAHAAWEKRCALEDEYWWLQHTAPWQIGSTLAEIFEGLGRYEEASGYCDRALAELDRRRDQLSRDELKTAISNDRSAQFLYWLGARLAFRRNDPAVAFHYLESGKGRALLDLMSNQPQHLKISGRQQKSIREWREVNARLQALQGLLRVAGSKSDPSPENRQLLEQKLHQETLALQELETTLYQELPNFHQLVNRKGRTASIPDLQATLGKGQLLIAYAYHRDEVMMWAVSSEGLLEASLNEHPGKELHKLSLQLQQALQNREPYQTIAEKLSEILLAPLAGILPAYPQLYVVPYGRLHLLPFQVLQVNGRALGASHQLSMLPSASVLSYFQEVQLAQQPKVLSIGNPTGDLKAAEMEALFVAHLFDVKALTGKQAKEETVRAALPDAELIHLATHGDLSEETPLASCLWLADDQAISLYELMGMQLNAQLVVLSACESGKGETTSGDDVVGLTRGLLAAGARSAVVSLWPVDDASTALFMQYFYEHLREHRSPAQALAHAQEQLRAASPETAASDLQKKFQGLSPARQRSLRGIKLNRPADAAEGYGHPYYWAPFFYVGRF